MHLSDLNLWFSLFCCSLFPDIKLLDVFQIFRGLAYIHTVPGVCHRDLKPQNLLVYTHWFYMWIVGLDVGNRYWYVLRVTEIVALHLIMFPFGSLQVDPLTHQVKLCDFGSAKMLVCCKPLDLSMNIIFSAHCVAPFWDHFLTLFRRIVLCVHMLLDSYSFDDFCLYCSISIWWFINLSCILLSSGERRSKHSIHMFTFLSGSWTNFWCNGLYNFNWYLVSWLCLSRASFGPGEQFFCSIIRHLGCFSM